jgi:hypothetical protein
MLSNGRTCWYPFSRSAVNGVLHSSLCRSFSFLSDDLQDKQDLVHLQLMFQIMEISLFSLLLMLVSLMKESLGNIIGVVKMGLLVPPVGQRLGKLSSLLGITLLSHVIISRAYHHVLNGGEVPDFTHLGQFPFDYQQQWLISKVGEGSESI